MRLLRALAVAVCLLSGPAVADELDMEGPVPADRGRAVPAASKTGLWLSTRVEAGVWARDPVVGAGVGVFAEHRWLRARFFVPVALRVWDVGDKRPWPGPSAVCTVVRCAEWVDDTGQLTPWSLPRLIERIEVGQPDDLLFASVGPHMVRGGAGGLLDGVNTALTWETRSIGAVLTLRDPGGAVEGEAFVADVVAPHTLSAAQVTLRPGRWFFDDDGPGYALLRRVAISQEVAADVMARPGSATSVWGQAVPALDTRPLAGTRTALRWPLFAPRSWVTLTPYTSVGVLQGLSRDGVASWWPGAGALVGVRGGLTLPIVAVRGEAEGFVDSPHHRHGVFSPLYRQERIRTVTGHVHDDRTLAESPAPGGVGLRAGLGLAVLKYLRAGARLHLDSAPAGNYVQGQLDAGGAGARLGMRVIHKGFGGSVLGGGWSASSSGGVGAGTQVAAEAAVAVWGPMSIYGRVSRTARRPVRDGPWRSDVDVAVGLSSDIVLTSPYLDAH